MKNAAEYKFANWQEAFKALKIARRVFPMGSIYLTNIISHKLNLEKYTKDLTVEFSTTSSPFSLCIVDFYE